MKKLDLHEMETIDAGNARCAIAIGFFAVSAFGFGLLTFASGGLAIGLGVTSLIGGAVSVTESCLMY